MSTTPDHFAPVALAAELAAFADTMLPGEPPFPSGAAVGAQAALAARLVGLHGEAVLQRLVEALARAGGPLAPQDQAGREAILARFEAAESDLFADVRKLLYFAYYESPLVLLALRATGLAYSLTPQPDGYAMAPFDPARDTPRHGRGAWTPTGEVVRLDLPEVLHD